MAKSVRKKRDAGYCQGIEGEWYPLGDAEFTECCCCGLTHRTEYKIDQGEIFERVWVEWKLTKAARKRLGIVVEKDVIRLLASRKHK